MINAIKFLPLYRIDPIQSVLCIYIGSIASESQRSVTECSRSTSKAILIAESELLIDYFIEWKSPFIKVDVIGVLEQGAHKRQRRVPINRLPNELLQ
ncbi:hypothetical protein CDAR_508771 [Caerostris darwini]|uniref:Uncharacterized protein n=1 Tax=Caerostris darwini TaxID=1538125 RepID=A0AAV4N3B4_9ARAC|nr:hypothetical protein CDAR_508771 [Caerostris darwini]